MWPATKVVPKELLAVGRIPAIAHIVSEQTAAGITEVIIVAAQHNSSFMRTLFDPSIKVPDKVADDPVVCRFLETLRSCSIQVIEQKGNYGNGTPLLMAAEQFGIKSCVYAFGDDLVIGDESATRGLIDIHERTGMPVLGAQEVAPERKMLFGILECEERDGEQFITRVLEKPNYGETKSNLASFGRYLVTPAVLKCLGAVRPGKDSEIWFIDAVKDHLEAGGDACVYRPIRAAWYTIGDPRSYAEAVSAATKEQLAYAASRRLVETNTLQSRALPKT